jgi:hypothetical protein
MPRVKKDNRPPKEKRHLKKGDINSDGLLFWQYVKDRTGGEWWVTKERFDKLMQITRSIKNKYKKSEKGKASQRRYEAAKRKNDPQYKLRKALRDRLLYAIKSQSAIKTESAIDLVGCSITEVMDHIASKFTDGMSWENHGEWHIDHIKPCASFDLSVEGDRKSCFHYTNLQPLWALDNKIKSDKIL